MSALGTEPVRLTNNTDEDWWPDWSPDGTMIVFTTDREGNDDDLRHGRHGRRTRRT